MVVIFQASILLIFFILAAELFLAIKYSIKEKL
jgi:hypothetical protein